MNPVNVKKGVRGFIKRSKDPLEAFYSYTKQGENGCIEWTGAKWKGYGTFWYEGRAWRSARWALKFIKGTDIDGLYACHRCDNPSCVNVDHLFAGTQKENVTDMYSKGRSFSQDEQKAADRNKKISESFARRKAAGIKLGRPNIPCCINGHKYEEGSFTIYKNGRRCIQCHANRKKRYAAYCRMARKRAKEALAQIQASNEEV